jgi:hypothetical protein
MPWIWRLSTGFMRPLGWNSTPCPPSPYSSGSLSAPAQQPHSLGRSKPSSGLFFAELASLPLDKNFRPSLWIPSDHKTGELPEAASGGFPWGRFSNGRFAGNGNDPTRSRLDGRAGSGTS